MRYAWDQFDAYFGPEQVGTARQPAAAAGAGARWPAGTRATAGRVDRFLANSQYVAGRIRRYYNRGSTVVYPPVDTAFYRSRTPRPPRPEPASSIVSALVPYKRLDLAIEACRRAGVPLTNRRATGPNEARLRTARRRPTSSSSAGAPTRRSATCIGARRAVLLPGDGGLRHRAGRGAGLRHAGRRARRAAARSKPSIDGETGVLVADDVGRGVRRRPRRASGALRFDPAAIRAHAERFSRDAFMTGFPGGRRRRRSPTARPRDDAAVQPPARRSSTSSPTRCSAWSAFVLAYLLRFDG